METNVTEVLLEICKGVLGWYQIFTSLLCWYFTVGPFEGPLYFVKTYWISILFIYFGKVFWISNRGKVSCFQ